MLEIRIETLRNHIKTYSAVGHSDHTCGSVTCVSRTFVLLARELTGVTVNYDAPREGEFSFEVFADNLPPHLDAYLDGLTQFLIKAIKDLELEFPDEVKVGLKASV